MKGSAPGGATTAKRARGGTNVHDHVLNLQRDYGNAAVTGVVVQRRPKAASTDAPGYKKKKPAPPAKKAAEPTDYAPTAPNPKFSTWDNAALSERASHESEATAKNSLFFAAELYEEYWFRTKARQVGIYLGKIYRKVGDEKRAAYWTGVATGSIKPGEKKAADEDMSDKAF